MVNPSTNTPSPSLDQMETSLTSLTTAAHILNGFAHRNKNQHRGTRWWASFDMLRRHLVKILPDLEGAFQREEILSSGAAIPSTKRRKAAGTDGARAARKQPELDRVVERIGWLHEELVTRCYEAFSQLTADRQFAQLGLVLIGVLAQVEAAIAPLVPQRAPSPAAPPEGEAQIVEAAPGANARGEPVSRDSVMPGAAGGLDGGKDDDDGGGGDDDLGVAVSRDELLDPGVAVVRDPSSSPAPGEQPAAIPNEGHIDESRGKKRKKVKRGDGALVKDSRDAPIRLPSPSTESLDATRSQQQKKKKKKKNRKGGDEFDDLFSSLV